VLSYVEHLRRERGNGDAAVGRHGVVLRSFYRAMVAMGELPPAGNPMAHFPKLKAPSRKLPRVLSEREVERLLDAPERHTVLGVRDRALLHLLYGTGIRASEAASLRERDVDLAHETGIVCGKGGHERTLPINAAVTEALRTYRHVRGVATPEASFFVSRQRRALTRGGVYEARARAGYRREARSTDREARIPLETL